MKRVVVDGPWEDVAPVETEEERGVVFGGGCRVAAVRYRKWTQVKGKWELQPRLAVVPLRAGAKPARVDVSGMKVLGDSMRFSEDGRWLAFGSLTPPGLHLVAASGGKPKTIYNAKNLSDPGAIWIFAVK